MIDSRLFKDGLALGACAACETFGTHTKEAANLWDREAGASVLAGPISLAEVSDWTRKDSVHRERGDEREEGVGWESERQRGGGGGERVH